MKSKKKSIWVTISVWGHGLLDAAGCIPGLGLIPDALNTAWYAGEGDWTNMAFAAGAMIPGIGQAATAAKYGTKGYKAAKVALKYSDDVAKVAKTSSRWKKGYKLVDGAKDAGKVKPK